MWEDICMGLSSFLSRERIVAGPGYSRWLVPPSALAIHLCIGQAYAFSVFNKPLSVLIGGQKPAPGDWTLLQLSWIFSIAIICLGLSAAVFGRWVETGGPRRAMFAAACCFGAGFLVSAVGIHLHQIMLLYLGYGLLGGIGLGLGYIAPVSTLIKWFPDRPGLATGMAIMGFGGGALIGAPLAVFLMTFFKGTDGGGVTETFVVMGLIYFVFMMFGMLIVRVPAESWRPAGYQPKTADAKMVVRGQVDVSTAVRTPQFYLLWIVLCFNVTAGIGVLSQASPMIQEVFPGRVNAVTAGGFVGLLSLFNMGGRFFWSSISDLIGRQMTYAIFFLLGILLYALVPSIGHLGYLSLFVLCYGVILSMYGGGFATIPAYLRDLFGTMHVGAIHGRLLTAWSTAGVLGPLLIEAGREYEIAHGVNKADAYALTMYVMAVLLAVGFVANLLVRPVAARHLRQPDGAHA
jgi:MFS family permease